MNFSLSAYQQNIIAEFNSGNQFGVSAVAGSSKSTMMSILANQLPQSAKSIVLSFGSDIAKAMQEKLTGNTISSTIHSQLMKQWYPATKQYAKLNKYKGEGIAKAVVRKSGVKDEDEQYWSQVDAVSNLMHFAKVTLKDTEEDLPGLIETYGIVPFDGIEALTLDALRRSEDIRFWGMSFDDYAYFVAKRQIQLDMFDYGFVDECQDTSNAMREAIKLLCKRVYPFGDPNQSIYGFAGADLDSFAKMRDECCEGNEMPLSITYRCPVTHVTLAKQLVPEIEAAPNAREGVLDMDIDLTSAVNKFDGKGMVICRTNAPLIAAQREITKLGKVAVVNDKSIIERFTSIFRRVGKKEDWSMLGTMLEDHYRILFLAAEKKGRSTSWIEEQSEIASELWITSIERKVSNLTTFEAMLKQDFQENLAGADVVLSSGHRSKGLESSNVVILTKPSKRVLSKSEQLQEHNLEYVMKTRSKNYMGIVPI